MSQQKVAEQAAAPSKLMTVLILVAGLAVGGAAGATVVGPKLTAPAPTGGEAAEEGGDHGGGGGHGKKGSVPSAFLIENLVVNPAGTDGTRFLILTVAVETANEAENSALKAADARVRDVIGRVLGSRTVPELTGPDARDWLKHELAVVIAEAAHLSRKLEIYLPQYVMQ